MKENGKLPNKRNFLITGIFNSGFQEFDATYIIGDIRHVQLINKWQPTEVGAFEVFRRRFLKNQRKRREVYKEIPPTYNSITIEEKYYSIFNG